MKKSDCDPQLRESILIEMSHILLGVLFFTMKPYKKTWMSYVDGIVLTLVRCLHCKNRRVVLTHFGLFQLRFIIILCSPPH